MVTVNCLQILQTGEKISVFGVEQFNLCKQAVFIANAGKAQCFLGLQTIGNILTKDSQPDDIACGIQNGIGVAVKCTAGTFVNEV